MSQQQEHTCDVFVSYSHAERAWVRGELLARLEGADAHLVLARLAQEDGDAPAAREHARRARELATCDGPPDYTYKVAYEEAGAMLVQ